MRTKIEQEEWYRQKQLKKKLTLPDRFVVKSTIKAPKRDINLARASKIAHSEPKDSVVYIDKIIEVPVTTIEYVDRIIEVPIRSDKGKHRNKYDSSLPPKYKSYLSRANKKQLEFSLTVNEFNNLTEQPCTYCGNDGGGIDRKDSKIGYILSNCQPCCSVCNMMKYTHTEEIFLSKVNQIYEFRNK